MHIKLLDVVPFHKPDSKLLGYAWVQLSDKMRVMLNIFKNNNGHIFLKFPSTKIVDQYKPHIEFINLNIERDISTVVGEEVGKKLNHQNPQPQMHPTGTQEEFPF